MTEVGAGIAVTDRTTFERALALVGALAIAALLGLGVYRLASGGAGEVRPVAGLVEHRETSGPEPIQPDERRPLMGRNIFEPPGVLLQAGAGAQPAEATPRAAPGIGGSGFGGPLVWSVPPVAPYLGPQAVSVPELPAQPGAGVAGPPPKTEPGPEAAGIAITAAVGSPKGMRVLVEDKSTGKSMWVESGQEAFGYRVSSVTQRGGLVEKGGRVYALPVGAGKPAPAAAPSPEPEAAGAGGTEQKTGASH